MKPENAADLLSEDDIDGGLIGGASLTVEDFAAILAAAGVVTTPLVCLVILDGWGLAPPGPGNAVELADTPTFDRLWAAYPHTQLDASGRAVGLPDGQMGNSEVGHTNLGAGTRRAPGSRADRRRHRVGRVLPRTRLLVDACRHGARVGASPARARVRRRRAQPPAPPAGADRARAPGGRRARARARLHRRARHLAARRVRGISTGSPASRRSSAATTRWTATAGGTAPSGRTTRSCTAWGRAPDDAVEAVKASYAAGVTDEFIEPVVIGDPARGPDPVRRRGDLLQLPARPGPRALVGAHAGRLRPGSTAGPTRRFPHYVQMTEYADDITAPVAFPGEDLADVLAQALAGHGVAQLHVAETEKYAHVTYFFDGGSETRCAGEEWELVDSPRDVADLRQEAEHERRARLPTTSSTASPTTATASASSTSRTPTWSATRA